eukprot:gnl/MRDRNA2_/MRDRNA2_90722_c0_seq1.p1 gnl/MRDRNA2_/MRDRNA2_90722_c0~~gnl/MRDRNA2_/MRDRNA2_90722_c0_seq1.p1  ORF type:complete len:554 (+),score=117.27 gnl/MRDRNA2_/MRDRNA2_90722_c0_seq1:91-1752(+)
MGGGASKKTTANAAPIKPPAPAPAPASPSAVQSPSVKSTKSPLAPATSQTSLSPSKSFTPDQWVASHKSMSPKQLVETSPAGQGGHQGVDASSVPLASEHSETKPSVTGATDEEYARIVGDTFGPVVLQSLTASKWDRKVDALKNISDVVKKKLVQPSKLATETEKQMISANNASCFRAACLVLQRSACDKILPVLLASHELIRGVFQQASTIIAEEELMQSLDTVLAQVWPKVGDSNIRLHDSAKSTIVFAAGLRFYRVSVVLERLHALISEKSRGHMRAKQISGVVDTVCSLVEHFPGTASSSWNPQMWTMDQISPFISSGLDDVVGPRTRIGAVKLAGAAYSKLGREAMDSLLNSLRPAVRNLLLQKFEELEKSPNDEPEIEDVPEVEVTVAQPASAKPPRTPLHKTATKSMTKSTHTAKPPTASKPNQSETGSIKTAKPPTIPKPPQSETVSIKAPVTPKAPHAPQGPSPRQKRFSPNSPSHKIFTPSSPTLPPPQQKWKSTMCAEEEDIMDQILEETGLVFGNGEKLTVGLDEEIDKMGLGGSAISCC